jgi:hypothetical protein
MAIFQRTWMPVFDALRAMAREAGDESIANDWIKGIDLAATMNECGSTACSWTRSNERANARWGLLDRFAQWLAARSASSAHAPGGAP